MIYDHKHQVKGLFCLYFNPNFDYLSYKYVKVIILCLIHNLT